MLCEYCGKEHCCHFGSGRFCSRSCASRYAAGKVKKRRCNFNKNVEELHSSNLLSRKWCCTHCGECFETRKRLYEHIHDKHPKGPGAWNKGLTKRESASIARAAEKYKAKCAAGLVKHNTSVSEVTKAKISRGMKKAHAEGRAHNIGQCRHNSKPSWPEEWFMRVISNEFKDTNYIREYAFGRYSLDFAWPDKKRCIEIDGEQHYRFQEYIDRDRRKDAYILSNGWNVLRLNWKETCANPKKMIRVAFNFIHEI